MILSRGTKEGFEEEPPDFASGFDVADDDFVIVEEVGVLVDPSLGDGPPLNT